MVANTSLPSGSRVTVYGQLGVIAYTTPDGWYGIRLDGESVVHEWQASQVVAS